jgi:hypothetical protein
MKRIVFLISVLTLNSSLVNAQDTIYTYDVASGSLSSQLMIPYDTSVVRDYTNPFFGIYGVTAMPDSNTVNPYPGTEFSLPQKAADFYSSFNFPFTAVSLVKYGFNTTMAAIGRNTLLAFNFDIYNTSNGFWRNLWDSHPFFENGSIQLGYDTLHPYKYYVRNSVSTWETICVIQMQEDIWNDGGYFGIAFDTSREVYDTTKFYNISYPKGSSTYYPPVNGDTMFFKYGRVAYGGGNYFSGGWGANGEYTSPYFDSNYRIYGIRWTNTAISIIKREDFYFIKYVSDSLVGVENLSKADIRLTIYPNPSKGVFTIKSQTKKGELEIYNSIGERVYSEKLKSETIYLNHPPGIYFVKVSDGEKVLSQKLIIQ